MSGTTIANSPQEFWNRAAETYEQDFAATIVGRTRRQAVWRELDRLFAREQRILELSCGTGLDAAHLAERGVRVLSCDISPRMIELAKRLRDSKDLAAPIEFRVLPTEDLDQLRESSSFDGAFSSFSGLNCVQDLIAVRQNLARLVKPGGSVLFTVMGRFVPWEAAWFGAHGEWKKATRRWNFRASFPMTNGDVPVQIRSVREMARLFAPNFRLRQWKGVGITVPPSYMDRWASRFSPLTLALAQIDRALARIPLIRNFADCLVLEFEHVAPAPPENHASNETSNARR
jgi:SAM-dependent methyltransferase